jgi:RNA polymerase sigma-70 factor (ECF subfamily)
LRREQGDELHRAVRKLPLDQREAILLKFEGRLKNKEIGVILNRSEGAVKLLLFRAVHGLRRRLGEQEKRR